MTPALTQPLAADIFCRVIDNYGDIGVCWRLARTLAHDHGWRIRLWVDAVDALQKLESGLVMHDGQGSLQGVELVHWDDTPPDLVPLDICIEAFACDPPSAYLTRLSAIRHLWLNLEYLSAEDWVRGCHLLPSPQANGVAKYFFFPGFQPGTGGLLREPGLLAARDAWRADPEQATALLRELGLDEDTLAFKQQADTRLIYLFSYPHAPVAPLLQALSQDERPTLLLLPDGVMPSLETGRRGALTVARHAFVDQLRFDRLLWSAELNLVRGEDSLVRATWAGSPLLWHIYPQAESAHLEKLQAWLDLGSLPAAVREQMLAWNAADSTPPSAAYGTDEAWADAVAHWQALLAPAGWQQWQTAARRDSAAQASLPDLASQLVAFCERTLPHRTSN